MTVPSWSVVEAREVTVTVAEANALYSRFHDLYDGLTWRLCRDPLPADARQIAPETYIVKSDVIRFPGFCVLTVVYSVDTDSSQINILDLIVDPI